MNIISLWREVSILLLDLPTGHRSGQCHVRLHFCIDNSIVVFEARSFCPLVD